MFANCQISVVIATNKENICSHNLFFQGGGHVQWENKCFLEGHLLMEANWNWRSHEHEIRIHEKTNNNPYTEDLIWMSLQQPNNILLE